MRVTERDGRVVVDMTRAEAERVSRVLREFCLAYSHVETYRPDLRLATQLRDGIFDARERVLERARSLSTARGNDRRKP